MTFRAQLALALLVIALIAGLARWICLRSPDPEPSPPSAAGSGAP